MPTAGTPVQPGAGLNPLPVRFLRFSAIAGLTGKCYLGTARLNKTTLAGVLKEFWPNAGGGVDNDFTLPLSERERYTLTDFWIDAAVSGEGLIISGGSAPL